MTDTEAGFLDATPLKPGSLCDFIIGSASLAKAVQESDIFYQGHSSRPDVTKGIIGAIHALWLARNPLFLHYEIFIHLYTCLDACFFVHRTMGRQGTRGPHAERINALCRSFGITTPSWAEPTTTPIAAYRNETLHEALFFGEPLGVRIFHETRDNRNTLLEMQNLACRLIVCLLGMSYADYVKSPIDDKMTGMLKL